jgi:hypothetical protein
LMDILMEDWVKMKGRKTENKPAKEELEK